MVELMSTIGENVKRLRAAAGLTQQGLAVAAGLSVSHVSQIEQGTNQDPRGSTLRALARTLGTTIDALLAEPDEPTPRRGRKNADS
jgi:transcriptional regulator with XRE-family HTH domain